MSKSHLINANIHRAKEGARVLEDIARFLLCDKILFSQIRDLRHRIRISTPIYNVKEDLGGVGLIENNVRYNLISIIHANALRLQEALRVLEEMAQGSIDKQLMKELRYQAYDLYSKLYYSAEKYLKWPLLKGLYLIIDTNLISYPLEEIIEIINRSEINMVQYRSKSTSKKDIFEKAYQIKKNLSPNKLFIINDHIDIALDLGDGIHLGQNDYPLGRVRNIVPDNFIIGVSCHSFKESRIAMQFNVSYIAVGCMFETKSKDDIQSVAIQELQKICDEVSIPVCAIGGIRIDNLDQILTTNIKMAALISSVWKTDNPLKIINDMHEKIVRRSKLS